MLRGIGLRPVASYFFLLMVLFVLMELYAANKLNLWGAIIVGLSLTAFLAWILDKRVIRPLEEIIAVAYDMAGGIFDKEIRIRSKDEIGDLAWNINYMAQRLKATIMEVTEEKNRAQAILTSMADGVIALDRNGQVLFANPVVEKLFGISQAACQGKSILGVIRNYEVEKLFQQALQSKQAIIRELQVLTPEPRTLRLHATSLKSVKGETGGVVVLFRDITKRRRLEQMRTEFVSNVSHELRTPLTSIKGYLETLLDGAADDLKVNKHFLEVISNETERLARLVDDLLNLSRIEDHRFTLRKQLIQLVDVLEKTRSVFQTRAEEKGVGLSVEAPEDLPSVEGDPDLLTQVFANLIDNAVKYTPSGGRILIKAGVDELVYKETIRNEAGANAADYSNEELTTSRKLKVEVQDTGIGIPQDSLPRIFERFYRVDKARSRELGGTGLGLAIVKHIIEAHGGKVTVESTVGKGSIFTVYLPLPVGVCLTKN